MAAGCYEIIGLGANRVSVPHTDTSKRSRSPTKGFPPQRTHGRMVPPPLCDQRVGRPRCETNTRNSPEDSCPSGGGQCLPTGHTM